MHTLLAAGVESAVGARAEELVLRLLYQIIAILVATRIVVWLARRAGQTDVSGEILAGLLLGPSALGALAPDLMHKLFDPSTATIFVGIAQVGRSCSCSRSASSSSSAPRSARPSAPSSSSAPRG